MKKTIIYLMMLVLVSFLVQATTFKEYFSGGNDIGTVSLTRGDGMTFGTNCSGGGNPRLINITLQDSSGCTKVYLFNLTTVTTGTLVTSNTNLSGRDFYMDVILNKGSEYHVACNKDGGGAYNIDRVESIPAGGLNHSNGGAYIIRGFRESSAVPDGTWDTVWNNQINNLRGVWVDCFGIPDTEAPTWDEYPQNISVHNKTTFSVDFNASDNIGVDKYFVNDTTRFQIDIDGIFTNNTV